MNAVSVEQNKTERIHAAEEARRFAFAYCMRRINSIEDARDFGQDFVRQYLEKQQADTPCELEWHILNVRNLFLNFLRSRKKYHREIPVPDLTTDSHRSPQDRHPPDQNGTWNPQEYLELDELLTTIEKVRRKFTDRDQYIINLKIQEYRSIEIAAMLPEHFGSITPVNIDVIYHRFKRKLEKTLIAQGITVHTDITMQKSTDTDAGRLMQSSRFEHKGDRR
ncbi:sigma-70 family RNA polymerase sigma factor [bacterium]|nr:sigma-70 family RNA polymerase sigma factor [candidate division CSSED10-310 bacterium]